MFLNRNSPARFQVFLVRTVSTASAIQRGMGRSAAGARPPSSREGNFQTSRSAQKPQNSFAHRGRTSKRDVNPSRSFAYRQREQKPSRSPSIPGERSSTKLRTKLQESKTTELADKRFLDRRRKSESPFQERHVSSGPSMSQYKREFRNPLMSETRAPRKQLDDLAPVRSEGWATSRRHTEPDSITRRRCDSKQPGMKTGKPIRDNLHELKRRDHSSAVFTGPNQNDLEKPKARTRRSEYTPGSGKRDSNASKLPISIPYTTPASEFLYGRSVVEAALKGARRKLYKLYLNNTEGTPMKHLAIEEPLVKLAYAKGVEVKALQREDSGRLLDKMSGNRPHNVRYSFLDPTRSYD